MNKEIESDIQKVTNEAIERWISFCLLQIQHKKQKKKENENAEEN